MVVLLPTLRPSAPGDTPQARVPEAEIDPGPMPYYEVGLGEWSRPVTTASPEAQAFFDQGVQLLFSFAPGDAARSFREAHRHDPGCAMCFFGEAWALGPYLNGTMRPTDAPAAHAAIREAVRLSRDPDGATAVERALIDAMAVRYEPVHDPGRRAALDSAYADALAAVHAAHPGDSEVAMLYAEALMLLEPRWGYQDVEDPSLARILQVLGGVLERDLHHPGACHLYVHATEATDRPELAERCAEHLGQSIPGASHINHMPSHTFNRLGRWGDATRANIEAWHSDLKAEIGEGFAIYPSHNLHMLLFSAAYDGQGAVSIQAARDFARIVEGGSFYVALTNVRFGRFDEVLELSDPPEDPIHRGLWDFARGYAHLRTGTPDSVAHYLSRLLAAVENTPDSHRFNERHTAASLLGIVGGILLSEVLRDRGRTAEAVTALESSVMLEDQLPYDEPEPLPFSARHWLGALLLEEGRGADAEAVYRADLERHARNGWSLLGLSLALRAHGDTVAAAAAHDAFREAWARSDTWIRTSRF